MLTSASYFARDIRFGDMVSDSFGRNYVAQTDAELDQWGDYNVLTSDGKYVAYSVTDIVTVEYTDDSTDVFEYSAV